MLDTRKWIAIGGSLMIISILATLALASQPPVWLPVGAIVGIGFLSASSTMVMTHGRGIIPDRLIGRGIATINTSVMFGVACMQTLSEIIVGAFEPLADGTRTKPHIAPCSACSPWCCSWPSRSTAARRTSSPATKCAPVGNGSAPELSFAASAGLNQLRYYM